VRWVFFLPVPVALVTLLAGTRLVPRDERGVRASRSFDVAGAATLTTAMLLVVFTVVKAPDVGWGSARTLVSVASTAAILALFVAIERRTAVPLVRLGILRSAPLVQANFAAMMLIGGWFGFQFIATLYMQQLRGWSPLETGLAIFPGGFLVAVLAPRIAPLVMRFGVRRLVTAGLASTVIGYALFLPIGLHSGYAAAMLPTMLFAGFGFALAYGPLNIAATNGVPLAEQGLASGLVNTSFQFGGALVLAAVAAVNNANVGANGSPQGLLDGFHAALFVSVIAASIGVAVTALRRRPRPALATEPVVEPEPLRRSKQPDLTRRSGCFRRGPGSDPGSCLDSGALSRARFGAGAEPVLNTVRGGRSDQDRPQGRRVVGAAAARRFAHPGRGPTGRVVGRPRSCSRARAGARRSRAPTPPRLEHDGGGTWTQAHRRPTRTSVGVDVAAEIHQALDSFGDERRRLRGIGERVRPRLHRALPTLRVHLGLDDARAAVVDGSQNRH